MMATIALCSDNGPLLIPSSGVSVSSIPKPTTLCVKQASQRGGPTSLTIALEWLTCPPKTGPATMRVQLPTMGLRRTLYGQTTLTGADRPQAPPGGGKASRWSHGPGDGQGSGHQRGYLPPL